MSEWTPPRVEERLHKALGLRRTLAADHSAPTRDVEAVGIIERTGTAPGGAERGDVGADAVEALSWLGWLEENDAALVIARLEGAPWKLICWRFGISRPTADRRRRCALARIALQLNGEMSASRWSGRQVLGYHTIR
jgi:hypothetical protein